MGRKTGLAVRLLLLIPFIPYNHSVRLGAAYVMLGSLLAFGSQLVNRVESLVSSELLGEQKLKGMPKPVAVLNLTGLRPA